MKTDKRTTAKIPAPGRDTSGRFLKGATGNPGGRPIEDSEVRQLARAHGPAAITRLAQLMHCDDPATCIAASKALLDRGFGKPTQLIDATVSAGPQRVYPAFRDMNPTAASQAYLDMIKAPDGEVEFLPPAKTEEEYAMERFRKLMDIPEDAPKPTEAPSPVAQVQRRPEPVAAAPETRPIALPRPSPVAPSPPLDPDERVVSVIERQDMEQRSIHTHRALPDSPCPGCRQLWVNS
jgi:hypothetical protein